MLTIRLQRLGRKGHPTYRVVVQDSRQTPTSGKFVAHLGSYDPHSKKVNLEKEKAEFYLKNGAQPSDRVVRLLSGEGVKLPSWVKQPSEKTRDIRNPDKLRKNQPAEESKEPEVTESSETPAESADSEEIKPAENTDESSAEEKPTDEEDK